jgi:hypothetical protein
VAKAEPRDFAEVLARLSLSTGHVLSADRLRVLSEDLAAGGWSLSELSLAARLIPTDARLMKEINYARTLNSGVFAEARTRTEVCAGRLFDLAGAVEYAREHYRPEGDETERSGVGVLFEVVRVEGDVDENGNLKPYWRPR